MASGPGRRAWCELPFAIVVWLWCACAAASAGELGAGRDASARLVEGSLAALERGEAAEDRERKYAAYREGRELAQAAVEAEESNPDAHYALFATNGRLMEMEGAVANVVTVFRAKRELDRALELDPNHARSVAAKGILLHRLPWLLGGRDSRAEKFLVRAIELDPRVVDARVELARLYDERGEPQRAATVLRDAVAAASAAGNEREAAEARRLLSRYESAP